MKVMQQPMDRIFGLLKLSNTILTSVGYDLENIDEILRDDYNELARLYSELQESMVDLEHYLRVIKIYS